MHILIFLLLLIPSLCFGAAADSYITFSGNSGYVADNAALEQSGNSYFVTWVRFKLQSWNASASILLSKNDDLTGDNRSWLVATDDANKRPYYFQDKTGKAVVYDIATGKSNSISLDTVYTIVTQAYFNNPGTSGLTMFLNGNSVFTKSNSNVNGIFNNAIRVSIGSAPIGPASQNADAHIYEAGFAFADVPIITADSTVTNWTNQPGTYALPFTTSAVSRYASWGPEGRFGWPSGYHSDSGQVNASYTSSTVTAGASIWGANVTGSAFLIDSTADGSQFTRNWGGKITLTDSAGKTAVGYGGARGTGVSTFGAQIWSVADCTSDPNGNESGTTGAWGVTTGTMEAQSGVTYTGGWALRHIGAAGAYQGAVAVKAATAGALYFYDGWYANTASSGRLQLNRPGYSTVLKYLAIGSVVPSWNNTIAYFNPYLAESAFQLTITMGGAASAVTQYVDNVSIKRILTPGSTGVSVYNSPANIGVEASSGWTAQSGFNWNAIVSYTITGYETDFNMDFVGGPQATRWRPTSLLDLDRGPGFSTHWKRFTIP
jgi:hypothetical protein